MKILLVELERHFPHLGDLKAELHRIFGMEVSVHSRLVQMPHENFNAKNQKWDAAAIIWHLRGEFDPKREGKFMVMALSPYDLYADSLSFVYGLAEKSGNYAVLSYFRLDERFYGRRHSEKLFRDRVLKEALHEIGHLAGLEHCKSKKCVMTFSPNIIYVDRKKAEFCERCKMFL